MKKVIIFTEEELAEVNGMASYIQQLQDTNESLLQSRKDALSARDAYYCENQALRKEVAELRKQCEDSARTLRHRTESIHKLNKRNSELEKALSQREETLKSAYMETFRVRTNAESEISQLKAQIAETERDMTGTEDALKKSQENLAHTLSIANKRLETMNSLHQAFINLKRHSLAVVKNYRTGTIRVVSATRVDTYLKFGWKVLAENLLAEYPTEFTKDPSC